MIILLWSQTTAACHVSCSKLHLDLWLVTYRPTGHLTDCTEMFSAVSWIKCDIRASVAHKHWSSFVRPFTWQTSLNWTHWLYLHALSLLCCLFSFIVHSLHCCFCYPIRVMSLCVFDSNRSVPLPSVAGEADNWKTQLKLLLSFWVTLSFLLRALLPLCLYVWFHVDSDSCVLTHTVHVISC